MNKKIFISIILTLIIALFIAGCNKTPTETVETQPNKEVVVGEMLTVAPEINKLEEKTEYGNTIFYFQSNSSVENIKNGTPVPGDVVIVNNYKYIYNGIFVARGALYETQDNGWCVISQDMNRKTTDGINHHLFGVSVTSANYCYYGHKNLIEASDLPGTIKTAVGAFESCHNLKKTNKLPPDLIDARNMFAYCEDLESFPSLPSGLVYADRMFSNCIKITGTLNIPASIETYNGILASTRNPIKLKGDNINIKSIVANYANVS